MSSDLQSTEAGVTHNSWANLGGGLILTAWKGAQSQYVYAWGGENTTAYPLGHSNMIISLLSALDRHGIHPHLSKNQPIKKYNDFDVKQPKDRIPDQSSSPPEVG